MKRALVLFLILLLGCEGDKKVVLTEKPPDKPAPTPIEAGFVCSADETAVSRFAVFTLNNGQPLRWKKTSLTFSIDKTLPPETRAAVVESCRVWRAASGATLAFSEVAKDADISIIPMTDLRSTPYLAYTGFKLDPDSIKTSTIQINTYVYKFHRGAPYGVGPLPKSGKRDADIDGVILHELGHAVGLNHSQQLGVTMWPVIVPGSETIEADDVRGVRSLYGDGAK